MPRSVSGDVPSGVGPANIFLGVEQKTATAVAHVKKGKGLIKINGTPLDLVTPEILKYKIYEPILVLKQENPWQHVDIRVRVKGGGQVSQIYGNAQMEGMLWLARAWSSNITIAVKKITAIRQAIAKGITAFYQKYVDEASKAALKAKLVNFDRSLLVADPRRCEPKKFGGQGARSRFQKSYR